MAIAMSPVAVIVAELVSETVTVEVDIAMALVELFVSKSLPEELFLSDVRRPFFLCLCELLCLLFFSLFLPKRNRKLELRNNIFASPIM